MTDPIVSARNLTRVHGRGSAERAVVDDVSLEIDQGQLFAINGPSGSGKSTLLSLLGGLDRPTSGEISVLGERIDRLSEGQITKLRRHSIGFVFQSFQLIPELTAFENVLLPARLAGDRNGGRRRAEQLLDQLGLAERARQLPSELSGGEQQRIAIARALVMNPPLVLADEPTGNLDEAASESVLALLREAVTPTRAVVFVTHEQRQVDLADSTVILRDGRRV